MYRPTLPCPCSGMGAIDLSSLSWEDYLIFGGLAILALRGVMAPSRPRRRRKSQGITFAGAFPWLAVIAAGYVGYQIWSSGQSLGQSLGSGA